MTRLVVSDPDTARGRSITAREVLDRGASRITATLADQPETLESELSIVEAGEQLPGRIELEHGRGRVSALRFRD